MAHYKLQLNEVFSYQFEVEADSLESAIEYGKKTFYKSGHEYEATGDVQLVVYGKSNNRALRRIKIEGC